MLPQIFYLQEAKIHLDFRHIIYCISSVIRQFFSFQNNPRNLDPSYKMDLDLWDCLGRVKLILQQNFSELILICSHSRESKTPSFSRINIVYHIICDVQCCQHVYWKKYSTDCPWENLQSSKALTSHIVCLGKAQSTNTIKQHFKLQYPQRLWWKMSVSQTQNLCVTSD